MSNLLDFLRKYLYWLVFLVLETVSLVSLIKFNSYQGSVFFTTANDAVGLAYETASKMTAYWNLGKENQRLELENEQLRRQLYAANKLIEQQAALRADSIMRADSILGSYDLVAAQVIGMTTHRTNNLLTINKGERDGVRPEMGVVCSSGVVGIVYLTSAHHSVVLPLLNEHSQTSCRLHGSRHFGTMQWERGDPSISYVNNIPRHAKVKRGSLVETNGFSDIFPAGIPVGKVLKVSDSPNGVSYRLTIRLATDFSTLRNVSVITNYSQADRKLLEERADSLLENF